MIDSFFDKNLFQQVISGLIVLLVSIFLGNKEVGKTTISKFWKLIIILAWVSLWGGLYIIFNNFSNGGIYNVYVSMGISLAIFGFFLNLVGKFFIWWQH